MKKILLVLIGFVLLSLLTACWKSVDNGNDLEKVDLLEDLRGKVPLTLEDLDRINENRFPVSYTYNVYKGEEVIETWEYVYPENVDHNLLLPIEETMVGREVISSVMSHDRINTIVDITLQNGESYPVLYIINPDTLKYLWASLTTPTTTTLYTFSY